MKILMASTEMAPLARTGGLGNVLELLPTALQDRGEDVSVVLPLYRSIRENYPIEQTGVSLSVYVGGKKMDAEIFQCTAPNGMQVFLVGRDEYFDRSGIYGVEGGRGYDDNAERFIYFSRAVVELACHMDPAPDIIHAHDWQSAMIPLFLKERGLPFGSVLTIHNLAYQGSFLGVDFPLTHLAGHYYHDLEFHGRINFLKGGLLHADAITTVSERYAREILIPEDGCGLDGVLRAHAAKLSGILNGADYQTWNPACDPAIAAPYTPESIGGKAICRDALLKELELAPAPRGPIFAVIGDFTKDKGADLLIPLLDRLLSDDVRLVILSDTEPSGYGCDLLVAARRYPGKLAIRLTEDEALAHRVYAGADLVVIPSQLEPSGAAAMHALKYGAPPIARAVGGLYQIVQDLDPSGEDESSGANGGNGFVFFEETPDALADAIHRAKCLFRQPKQWTALRQRGMTADFSWQAAAQRYARLYQSIRPEVPSGVSSLA